MPQCLADLFLAGLGVKSKVMHLWMTLTHSCLAHRRILVTTAASDSPFSPTPAGQTLVQGRSLLPELVCVMSDLWSDGMSVFVTVCVMSDLWSDSMSVFVTVCHVIYVE